MADACKDDAMPHSHAEELETANRYVVAERDSYLLDILRRVSRIPGNYVGSMKLSALEAYLRGYVMARIDAGLPCESDLLLNFARWVMQSTGNPTLEGAMESIGAEDRVEPFFELFDRYLREHGIDSGLTLRTDLMDRYRKERGLQPGEPLARGPTLP